jgi:hypothetical protein
MVITIERSRANTAGGIGFILLQLCYKLRRDVTRRLGLEENLQEEVGRWVWAPLGISVLI